MQILALDLSPTFLNTETTNETFQHSGKQDSFRDSLLESSPNTYQSSGPQFIKTNTGMQSGSDPFDESRFGMTFLTILGVVKRKTGKEIPKS